jgi:hypothetical protein
MSQNKMSSEDNKGTCEAAGCFAKATKVLRVEVGQRGTISLLLCHNCVSKFGDN